MPGRRRKAEPSSLRIATFNINGIVRRLPQLLDWLHATSPDVVCLQELKAPDERFPAQAIADAGYGAVWHGQKSWNGVAILAKGTEPILTRTSLPGDPDDRESRYIEAAIQGILVASLYAPNGNPQPGPKFVRKLAWMNRLLAHAAELAAQSVPAILAGDYNVAPTDLDIYATRSWQKDALVQPEPRRQFAHLVESGWIDAIRTLHPDQPMYTFWDYMRRRWELDAGLRLDHLLLSPSLVPSLLEAGVDRDQRGHESASDHAPAWITLRPMRR